MDLTTNSEKKYTNFLNNQIVLTTNPTANKQTKLV